MFMSLRFAITKKLYITIDCVVRFILLFVLECMEIYAVLIFEKTDCLHVPEVVVCLSIFKYSKSFKKPTTQLHKKECRFVVGKMQQLQTFITWAGIVTTSCGAACGSPPQCKNRNAAAFDTH